MTLYEFTLAFRDAGDNVTGYSMRYWTDPLTETRVRTWYLAFARLMLMGPVFPTHSINWMNTAPAFILIWRPAHRVMQFTYEYNGVPHTLNIEPGPDNTYSVTIGDQTFTVEAHPLPTGGWQLVIDGQRLTAYSAAQDHQRYVAINGATYSLAIPEARSDDDPQRVEAISQRRCPDSCER